MDADAIGRICLLLGAGRAAVTDRVDPRVGVSGLLKIGDPVAKGQPLMHLHAANARQLGQALTLARNAAEIGERLAAPPDLILETIHPESA
jgi:thymidine phosphorylase